MRESRNGYFQLVHKEDGTYLKLYPAVGGGLPLSYDMAARYLASKKITDYNIKELADAIASLTQEKEYRLNQRTCLPEDESMDLMVDESRSKAKAVFFAPSTKGKVMTRQDIINTMVRLGIKFGVVEKNLDDFLADRVYCTEIILAESMMPVQGKNAAITYHFKTEGFGKPKINEDGSVDFHQLDMINKVNVNDVLATLEPADYGKPGMDIFGNVLKQAKVTAKVLRHGANIHLSEDKTIMYSDVAGHVTLADDRVFVSDTYEVPADVSVASGDIDYDGNVLVRGNVVAGFTVCAKGDIIVNGAVEGATLIAGGQIILKRGIQGMAKGRLNAKGNITARFIENCVEVTSGGDIATDAIMHSNVVAKGSVTVSGKKGIIAGGDVRAGKTISVRTMGTPMGTQTTVCIGLDDKALKEQKDLVKEIEEIKEEQKKYGQIFMLFKKRMESGNELNGDQKRQLLLAKQEFTRLQESVIAKEARNALLREEIENSKDGRIKFSGNVYPGVKVIISSSSMYIKNEVSYGQFVRDRGDIRIMAL